MSAEGVSDKRAPVQGYPPGIPWSMHLRAYGGYCKKWSPQPALIDLEGRNCRGGFSTGELDDFIPGWLDELSELAAARAQIAKLQAALEPFAAIAAPRHPTEEPDGPSAIDLMTSNGEYDELGMTSYTGAGPGAVILDADWFRKARAALTAETGGRNEGS